ncbi:MAG: hypothetical protein WC708_19950 [Lentisphaeria bacterium]
MNFQVECSACGRVTVLMAHPETPEWSCSCGAVFNLQDEDADPVAPPPPTAVAPPPAVAASMPVQAAVPGAQKSCPECGAMLPESNILCTECGFNFQKGSKVVQGAAPGKDAVPEEELAQLDRAFRRRRLIRAAVLAGVLLLGGGLCWSLATGKDYGINDRHPMGKTAALEKHITGVMKLAKAGPPRPAPAALGVAGTLVTYNDVLLEKETNGRFQQSMVLVYDAGNEICGVVGSFEVLSSAIPGGGISRISSFLKDYWEEIGAPVQPAFQNRNREVGGLVIRQEQAEFAGPGVRAVWRRNGSDGMGLISSYDTIAVVREGARPEALLEDEAALAGEADAVPPAPAGTVPAAPAATAAADE